MEATEAQKVVMHVILIIQIHTHLFVTDTSRTNRQDYDCLFIQTFRNELLILSFSYQCNVMSIFSNFFSHVYMLIITDGFEKRKKRHS